MGGGVSRHAGAIDGMERTGSGMERKVVTV